MRAWQEIDRGSVPGSNQEMVLLQRGEEFTFKVGVASLMNSRMHGSEEALAQYGCAHLGDRADSAVLVGGLGMGYTLATTLAQLTRSSQVTVAELVPSVVEWNRRWLGVLAGDPLNDPRVSVYQGDVAKLIAGAQHAYDAILLDVDNGPEGLTQRDNNWLYTPDGLLASRRALMPGGALAVWSESPSQLFRKRLLSAGFRVSEHHPRVHGKGRGGRHTIWVATVDSGW